MIINGCSLRHCYPKDVRCVDDLEPGAIVTFWMPFCILFGVDAYGDAPVATAAVRVIALNDSQVIVERIIIDCNEVAIAVHRL